MCAPYVPPTPFPNCPPMTCQPPCTPDSCASGKVCGDDGVCRVQRCDESGAEACAARYRCDPSAAATSVSRWTLLGAAADSENPELEAQRGCVRKLCDEEGGFACLDTWSCDPANAGEEASGCVPKPCTETGHCRDDATFLCEPGNDERRPEGMDPHGCVPRNCSEGRQCNFVQKDVNYAYCDLASPAADSVGCVIRQCDEVPELCPDNFICDVDARQGTKNAVGCRARNCNDPGGPACQAGSVCTPNAVGTWYCGSSTAGSGGSAGSAAGGSAGARPGGSAGAGSGGSGVLVGGADGSAAAPATGGVRAVSGASGGEGARTQAASGICVNRQ